jgi:hypothetical protein
MMTVSQRYWNIVIRRHHVELYGMEGGYDQSLVTVLEWDTGIRLPRPGIYGDMGICRIQ